MFAFLLRRPDPPGRIEEKRGMGIVPRKYGVYGYLIIIYPKPYSVYLRRTIFPQFPLHVPCSSPFDSPYRGTVGDSSIYLRRTITLNHKPYLLKADYKRQDRQHVAFAVNGVCYGALSCSAMPTFVWYILRGGSR